MSHRHESESRGDQRHAHGHGHHGHHDHDHDHHHDDDHHRPDGHAHGPAGSSADQGAAEGGSAAFAGRLEKLLEHWLRHNDDHVKSYQDWARQARDNGLAEAAGRMEAASGLMGQISARFAEALAAVRRR
jgi:hypothetical protein